MAGLDEKRTVREAQFEVCVETNQEGSWTKCSLGSSSLSRMLKRSELSFSAVTKRLLGEVTSNMKSLRPHIPAPVTCLDLGHPLHLKWSRIKPGSHETRSLQC